MLKFKGRLLSAQTDNPLCPAWRAGCQSSSVRAWPASLKCCDPNLSPRLLLSPVCANEPHSSEARGRGAKKGHLKKGSICLELKENHLSLQDETAPGWDWAPNGLKPQAVKFRRERWWKITKGVCRWGQISTFSTNSPKSNPWLCSGAFMSYLVTTVFAPIVWNDFY